MDDLVHAKKVAVRESAVEDHLVKLVKAKGGEVRKVKWIGRRGAPDRLVMIPHKPPFFGFNFYVELKRPKKGPTTAQAKEHERMRNCGIDVRVASTIAEVEELFK